MTPLLDELTTSGHQIANQAGPSVVGVGRRGTGVVVAPGLVATNAHNVTRRGGGRRHGHRHEEQGEPASRPTRPTRPRASR